MAQLFEEQQDTDNLVAYTHFDAWFWEDDDEERVWGDYHDDFDDYEKVAEMRDEVIKHWDKELGTHIYDHLHNVSLTLQGATINLTEENYWAQVILYLLRNGYDVFEGSTFIEIYSAEGAEEPT